MYVYIICIFIYFGKLPLLSCCSLSSFCCCCYNLFSVFIVSNMKQPKLIS